MQIVIFKLDEEYFAVETSSVQGINDMMEITKVPKAPVYIKGLINLRGSIISLVDLNLLVNNKSNVKEQANIIILNIGEEQIGITVDCVQEVIEIDENDIKRIENDTVQPYNRGIVTIGDRIVTIINIDKLLN